MRVNLQQQVASYSRRVAILRIGLPLAALALVAVLIWIPDRDQADAPSAGVNETGGEMLQYSGSTADGSTIDISSASFLEDGEFTLVESISAHVQNPDGSEHYVLAKAADTWNSKEYIEFSGGAVLHAVGNFTIEADGFRMSLGETALRSLGAVTFEFDGGSGRAGEMKIVRRVSETEGLDSWSFIEFSDGVEVVFLESGKSEL